MYPIAILFILLGAAIKYGKMYFLIAGYNTMPAKEKAKYDIKSIANLFRNVMFTMGGLMLVANLAAYSFDMPEIEGYVFYPTLCIGLLWLIIRSNTKKYRING
jgi:hypothetical protein